MGEANWGTDPDIQLAKRVAAGHKASAAMVIWIEPDGTVGGASDGVSARICTQTGVLLDAACDAIERRRQ